MSPSPIQITSRQIALVRTSLTHALPHAAALAELFYARLFELDPSTRMLFPPDMNRQGRKLVDMLDVFAGDLTRWEVLRPAARRLGARHADYGVLDAHYGTVGAALLWALEQTLAGNFTSEVRAAWEAVYVLLTNEMREGSRLRSS
ncbi:globin domain-containing protein [Deinococcus hopiensis]|uniref:Hemoglobin-like flavoprotein n=1 Tax=Deinococcus hopiensis KR-140 TaxID=695939 RepID=A0A1W1USG8_9DEIO|nr:globin domain-containing protein [Deinococcus hopiensis]SMB83983.1 Hemoglobin-like flavoprotein [Deinococcus hopiensis KR-140]